MSKGLYYLPFANTRPRNIQVANSKGMFKLPSDSWKKFAADEMQNCKRELGPDMPPLLCICIGWQM